MKRPTFEKLIAAFFLLFYDFCQLCSSFQIVNVNRRGHCLIYTELKQKSSRISLSAVEANSISTTTTYSSQLEVEEKASEKFLFISLPKSVYIEDTDAYGVIYNGNYIKCYERALHELHINRKRQNYDGNRLRLVLDYDDFYVTRCTEHKFKSSPALGSKYVVKGLLVHRDSELEETWKLEMVEYTVEDESSKVYNTALVTISAPTKESTNISPSFAERDVIRKQMPEINFTIQRDEFDIHMPGAIPMSTALTFFERARSDSLGGPSKLRQMQEEDNLLWVVTSMDDLQIDTRKCIQPGEECFVGMYCAVKRKGMIVICDQTIFKRKILHGINSTGSDENNDKDIVVLAKGSCTICAVDKVKGRPTGNIPKYVKDIFR